MERHDKRAAAGEPDGGLAGRVVAADDGHPRGAGELRLGWPDGMEHAQPIVVGEPVDGESPALSFVAAPGAAN